MRALRRSAALVALTGATLVLGAAPVAADDDGVPLPTYELGFVWPLADGAYELIGVDDGVYVFRSADTEIRLTKTLGLVGMRRGEDFLELTNRVELTWPLKPGDWGASTSHWRASGTPPTPWGRQRWGMAAHRLTWSAEDWDEIGIGSNKVRALRIVYRMNADSLAAPQVQEWEIVAWYAPDAGVLVRAVDNSFGLVNFELAPSADISGLRVRAGVPGSPPRAATSRDWYRRHREAVPDACEGLKCARPMPRLLTD